MVVRKCMAAHRTEAMHMSSHQKTTGPVLAQTRDGLMAYFPEYIKKKGGGGRGRPTAVQSNNGTTHFNWARGPRRKGVAQSSGRIKPALLSWNTRRQPPGANNRQLVGS